MLPLVEEAVLDRGIRHILAPVDPGANPTPALRYVRMLAGQFGARITLLHVVPALALRTYDDLVAGVRELDAAEAEHFSEEIRQIADLPLGGVEYEVAVVADDPARAIVEAAERHEADLVVMPAPARQLWKRIGDGSIAEEVLRTSKRAVVLVPFDGLPHGARRISRVICPVNLSPVAREAAEVACAVAKSFRSDLVLVDAATPNAKAIVRQRDAKLLELGEELDGRCSLHELAVHGDRASGVLECADELDADLIVIGAQHRKHHDTESVVGSTTEWFVRASRHPVLAVVRQVESGAHEQRESEAFAAVG